MTTAPAALAGLLPRTAGRIRLDRIGVDGLLALRRLEDEEGFDRLTCRPLHSRTEQELRALYEGALGDSTKLICGIYLPGLSGPVGKLTATDYNCRNRSACGGTTSWTALCGTTGYTAF